MKKTEIKNYNVNINRATAKKSKLSSRKKDKYEYMAGEEILSLQQQGVIQEIKCSHSSLGIQKAKENHWRITKKSVEALQTLNLTNTTNKLKQAEDGFIQSQWNNWNHDKLKEMSE